MKIPGIIIAAKVMGGGGKISQFVSFNSSTTVSWVTISYSLELINNYTAFDRDYHEVCQSLRNLRWHAD